MGFRSRPGTWPAGAPCDVAGVGQTVWLHLSREALLGGSCVVRSGVYKSPNMAYNIGIVTILITPFITTHEPPSRASTQGSDIKLEG